MTETNVNKSKNKRYYWLKLNNTYFNQLEQKKMRRQEHGKDMQIIYLRMMLLSIDKGGFIYYQGVYDTIEEELAEEFSEDVELVRATLKYLSENNMMTLNENSDCFLPQAVECTGSESYSAERMRRMRKKSKVSQCDADVTACDASVTAGDEEIEKELDKEIENRERVDYQQIADLYNETCVSFPRLTKLSDSRKKAIRARLKQYGLDDFRRMFEIAESSDFLKGKNNKNWSATFDWMVKDANMAKILDGNYNDKKEGGDNGEQNGEAGGSTLYQNLVLLGYRGREEDIQLSDKFTDGPFG